MDIRIAGDSAIISSVPFWLMLWKRKYGLWLKILGLLTLSPWLFLFTLPVLMPIASYFGVKLV